MKVDLYFLCDTTGSMSGSIASVRQDTKKLIAYFQGQDKDQNLDIALGVAHYRDVADHADLYVNQLTPKAGAGNLTAVTAELNKWSASGGGETLNLR